MKWTWIGNNGKCGNRRWLLWIGILFTFLLWIFESKTFSIFTSFALVFSSCLLHFEVIWECFVDDNQLFEGSWGGCGLTSLVQIPSVCCAVWASFQDYWAVRIYRVLWQRSWKWNITCLALTNHPNQLTMQYQNILNVNRVGAHIDHFLQEMSLFCTFRLSSFIFPIIIIWK